MNLFDVLLLLILLAGVYYGYQKGLDSRIVYFLKIFFVFFLGGRYCVDVGLFLSRHGILRADNYAMFLLVGFLMLAVLLWVGLTQLEKWLLARYIYHRPKINKPLGALLLGVESGVLFSFAVILLMQFSWVQNHASAYIITGKSYPVIHQVTMRFLSVKRVKEIINGNVTGGSKEMMINLMGK